MATTKKTATKRTTATGESPSERARRLGPATMDRLRKKQPRTEKVEIVLDDDTAAEVERFRHRVAQLRLKMARVGEDTPERAVLGEDLAEVRRQLADAEDRLADETVTMSFRAIGNEAYDELLLQHPATDEQVKEAKDKGVEASDYDPETFAPALIAASAVEPELTLDEVNELAAEWNSAEFSRLFFAALIANTQRREVDLGKR